MPLLTYTHRREGITWTGYFATKRWIRLVAWDLFSKKPPKNLVLTIVCQPGQLLGYFKFLFYLFIYSFIFIQWPGCSGIPLVASFPASWRQDLLVSFSILPTLHQEKAQSLGSQSSKHLKCEFYLGLALLKACKELKFCQMSSFHVLSWALTPFLLSVCWINSQIVVEAEGAQFPFGKT